MSFDIAVTGEARKAVERIVPQLVSDLVASRITAQDPTLWGSGAEVEAAIRLGWTEAVVLSEPLVDDIIALRDALRGRGIHRVVLCGMGGSSLAPEVIAATAGAPLTVLDSTDPDQVRGAIGTELDATVVVVSSKSGSTVETDSQRRVFEEAFRTRGIDPVDRIVVVTDPDSPLDIDARAQGYRVFNADPNVGGRYSALTAFGLVPSGLAGVDIQALLDEAESVSARLAADRPDNPGLILGAAIAGTRPLKDKLGIVADGTHLVGFGSWVEQLIAESTGKEGKGILPVVLERDAPELGAGLHDLQIVRLVGSERDTREVEEGEIEVSGTLGAQFLVWEYATAVAGRILGIDPFDQPDVEKAKAAARALLDSPAPQSDPDLLDGTIEVTASPKELAASGTLESVLDALLKAVPADGYLAIHAYLDRIGSARVERLRALLAARVGRPVTFGWGPRFLHSSGQYHKGGPANGAFLQLIGEPEEELTIPGRAFGFGRLIRAQADGDASVLAQARRPVVTLRLGSASDLDRVIRAAEQSSA